ncbi:LysE family translocator [Gemmobacter fulvus]|uniref:LysE family translocator n=1 Tax=Gemmobacter fulvus TaxID=2840474 RepID=A0A975P433_9RHOB|nr:LysE family translocator [Gemmobacter fulvus]MBT9247133.1 LysE family translocator [Gemmobacter fulvus]MDQ1849875.1 LysE family translocator [Gemmobacter fulvus]QWK88992.1 LysE family translocator [Gemmobacter fulvus]
MTVSAYDLLLYAGGMALLWVIPGPVWVALVARALSGGFSAAWPLAVGVALGDLLWPLCAVFGLSWILSLYGGFLDAMQWVAAATFILMGILLIRKPAAPPDADSTLTRPGMWAGFAVGVAAVIGNPKAILFYMGVLPGFFDLSRVTAADIAAILLISALVPMLGNLGLALFLDRARALLSSPQALHRLNVGSGVLLVCVGLFIALS